MTTPTKWLSLFFVLIIGIVFHSCKSSKAAQAALSNQSSAEFAYLVENKNIEGNGRSLKIGDLFIVDEVGFDNFKLRFKMKEYEALPEGLVTTPFDYQNSLFDYFQTTMSGGTGTLFSIFYQSSNYWGVLSDDVTLDFNFLEKQVINTHLSQGVTITKQDTILNIEPYLETYSLTAHNPNDIEPIPPYIGEEKGLPEFKHSYSEFPFGPNYINQDPFVCKRQCFDYLLAYLKKEYNGKIVKGSKQDYHIRIDPIKGFITDSYWEIVDIRLEDLRKENDSIKIKTNVSGYYTESKSPGIPTYGFKKKLEENYKIQVTDKRDEIDSKLNSFINKLEQ